MVRGSLVLPVPTAAVELLPPVLIGGFVLPVPVMPTEVLPLVLSGGLVLPVPMILLGGKVPETLPPSEAEPVRLEVTIDDCEGDVGATVPVPI